MIIEQKAQAYAMSFFFSLIPDQWDYEQLTTYLRKQEGDFNDMIYEMNIDEDFAPWEPFEEYNPFWVADQMDMMVMQLTELFKESK